MLRRAPRAERTWTPDLCARTCPKALRGLPERTVLLRVSNAGLRGEAAAQAQKGVVLRSSCACEIGLLSGLSHCAVSLTPSRPLAPALTRSRGGAAALRHRPVHRCGGGAAAVRPRPARPRCLWRRPHARGAAPRPSLALNNSHGSVSRVLTQQRTSLSDGGIHPLLPPRAEEGTDGPSLRLALFFAGRLVDAPAPGGLQRRQMNETWAQQLKSLPTKRPK